MKPKWSQQSCHRRFCCRLHRLLSPISDAELIAFATRLALDCGRSPLWLFVYGSLLWNPALDHVEQRRAVVHGWRRAFCLSIRNYRATPQAPGLMLALARGGCCLGAVFRLPDGEREALVLRLLRREISYLEDVPAVRWVNARITAGLGNRLAFEIADLRPAVGPGIGVSEVAHEVVAEGCWRACAAGQVVGVAG